MAVQKHARDLLFHDLIVSRRTEQAPYPELSKILPIWVSAVGNLKLPPKEFEGGMVTCILKDAQHDPLMQVLTLLIEVSDKNAPNSSIANHDLRTVRHVEKDKPEGNGFSAHVFISTKPQAGAANTYLTLIESIPTVTTAKIQSMLNTLIRDICRADKTRFTFNAPGGGAKIISYVPHIVFVGYPSDQFLVDIEVGKINGLKVVAPANNTSLGANPFLTFKDYSASIEVSKDIPAGQRWKTILGGLKLTQAQFPKARISIRPENEGKSFHVDVDTATGAIIGEAYIKSRRISPIAPMMDTSSPEKIVPHFAMMVKTLLMKERKG